MLERNEVSAGIKLWFIATLAAAIAIGFLATLLAAAADGIRALSEGPLIGIFSLVQAGAWQWLYVIPLIIWLRRRQRFEQAKGLLITACVLLGIDVLCSGALLLSFR